MNKFVPGFMILLLVGCGYTQSLNITQQTAPLIGSPSTEVLVPSSGPEIQQKTASSLNEAALEVPQESGPETLHLTIPVIATRFIPEQPEKQESPK